MAVEREEIGRRIELDVLLVSSLLRVAPDYLYCAVRHEQRARVIKPRIRRHSGRSPGFRRWIEQIGRQACRCPIFVHSRSTQGEDLAGRQNDRIHAGPWQGHWSNRTPRRIGHREIDDLGGCGRIGRVTAHDHDLRKVTICGT